MKPIKKEKKSKQAEPKYPAPVEVEAKQIASVQPRSMRRVLVVDDEEPIRLLFQGILKNQSAEFAQAGTGEEALNRLENEVFDLVFLDIRLPDMDGIEILRKTLALKPNLKIVVMTGHGDARQALTAVKLGAIEYLSKPFPIKHVQKILRLHLFGGLLEVCSDVAILPEKIDEPVTEDWSNSSILLVDDNEILLSLLTQVTAQIGCRTASVSSVGGARELLARESYDLIVTDIKMPGASGIELLEWVREQNIHTGVVLVTGHPTIEGLIEALRLGALDFIIRPFSSLEAVIETVTRALKRHAIHQKNRELEETLKRRNFQLELLYKISHAVSHTLRHDVLVNLIMESIAKVIHYDVGASFLTKPDPSISVYIKGEIPVQEVTRCERQVYEAFSILSGVKDPYEKIAFSAVRLQARNDGNNEGERPLPFSGADTRTKDKAIFFNVPLMIGQRVFGMIHISRLQGNSFNEEDVRLVSTIANQMTNAVERVREIKLGEKGKTEIMVENMTEGVVMMDIYSEDPMLNPKARQMLDFEVGKKVTNKHLTEKMNSIGLYEAFDKCRNKKSLTTAEINYHEGKGKSYLCRFAPVTDEENDVVAIVIVLIDMTDRKAAEEKMNELTRDLARSNKELEQFAYTISHDLKAPLRSVISFSALLRRKNADQLNQRAIEDLDMVIEQGKWMNEMIEAILELSRIGRKETGKEVVNMKTVVQGVLSRMEADIKEKNARVTIEGEFPTLVCFKQRVVQAFLNLIGNGLKYVPQGRNPEIVIGCRKKDSYHWFYVKDNGIGINKKDFSRIFDVFQRLHPESSPYKGTGIGLANVKKIIKVHGGEIYLESEEGKGAAFYFTLAPVQKKKIGEILLEDQVISKQELDEVLIKQKQSLETSKRQPGPKPKTNSTVNHVLALVDDSFHAMQLFKRIMEEMDAPFPISYLTSGEEALAYIFGRKKFQDRTKYPMCSVMLLDINMPGLTGFDVLCEIKKDVRFRELPRIAMYTSSASVEDREKSLQLGANRFITKDDDHEGLLRQINELMAEAEAIQKRANLNGSQ